MAWLEQRNENDQQGYISADNPEHIASDSVLKGNEKLLVKKLDCFASPLNWL